MTTSTALWHSEPAARRSLCSDCMGDIVPEQESFRLAVRRLTYRKGPRKGQERTFCARCATPERARELAGAAG